MFDLILVSQSPRRKEILEKAGISFRVDTVKVSEILEENINLPQAIMNLAQYKAESYLNHHNHLKSKNILLLSADTMVISGNKALGKPKNSTEAKSFLRLLSGQTHSVITGFCLKNLSNNEEVLAYDSTEVEFKNLTEVEIEEYIDTGEPMDKAGAYAIQGIGKKFVKGITGSYENVVGLPLEKVLLELKMKNWKINSFTKN
jgi:septum formation protein